MKAIYSPIDWANTLNCSFNLKALSVKCRKKANRKNRWIRSKIKASEKKVALKSQKTNSNRISLILIDFRTKTLRRLKHTAIRFIYYFGLIRITTPI